MPCWGGAKAHRRHRRKSPDSYGQPYLEAIASRRSRVKRYTTQRTQERSVRLRFSRCSKTGVVRRPDGKGKVLTPKINVHVHQQSGCYRWKPRKPWPRAGCGCAHRPSQHSTPKTRVMCDISCCLLHGRLQDGTPDWHSLTPGRSTGKAPRERLRSTRFEADEL